MMNGVSRETESELRQYHTLLLKWQEKINLISPNTLNESWHRHFKDSLQLLPFLPERTFSLYDLGSGAGFPGLVLAIARPEINVHLIESDAKKCAFLKAVSRETGVAVSVQNIRIEIAARELPPPDIVTARALAPLNTLFQYVWPWAKISPDMTMIFPKGERWQAEIEAARQEGWAFDVDNRISATEADARLLLFKNLRKSSV